MIEPSGIPLSIGCCCTQMVWFCGCKSVNCHRHLSHRQPVLTESCVPRVKADLERKEAEFDENVSRLQAKHVSELKSYLDLIREAEQTKDALMAEISALKEKVELTEQARYEAQQQAASKYSQDQRTLLEELECVSTGHRTQDTGHCQTTVGIDSLRIFPV